MSAQLSVCLCVYASVRPEDSVGCAGAGVTMNLLAQVPGTEMSGRAASALGEGSASLTLVSYLNQQVWG